MRKVTGTNCVFIAYKLGTKRYKKKYVSLGTATIAYKKGGQEIKILKKTIKSMMFLSDE